MKSVSWDEAFRKLNEWRERESAISFGDVRDDVDAQGNASPMHFFGPIVRVVSADATTGVVSLSGEKDWNCIGASFLFFDWNDLPFDEKELGPSEFESSLEVTFPDGRVFVLAREWPVS
jgi:hypothetical protein